MPQKTYRLKDDDQMVYTCQLIGGPKGYYKRQHDRILVAGSPPLSGQNLRHIFNKTASKLKNRLDRKVFNGSGSTATMAFIGADDVIRTANIGDSRVTLFIRRKNGNIDGFTLTNDHDVYNYDERQRLDALGAVIHDGYILAGPVEDEPPALAVSRAFGDGFFSKYVIDEPEILEFNLADPLFDIHPEDEIFIAVDTDGVHMGLTPTYRAGALAAFLANPDNSVAGAANYLMQLAILCGSGDNLSIAFARLNPERKKNLVLAAFDGHGPQGYQVSEAALQAVRTLLHKPSP